MRKERTVEESDVLKRFGNHLRELRLAHQLSQEELAASAHFSRSY
jgi:DNA-binding XRE family transcriptional regulator